MMVGSYSSKEVVVLIDGVPMTGLADGDSVVNVERNQDAFSMLVGMGGDAVAMGNADRSGFATIQFLQTSRSNAILSAKLKVQEAGVISLIPFLVKDTNGLDLAIAESALIAGPPRMAYGQGHNAREWRLLLPAVDIFAGGSL